MTKEKLFSLSLLDFGAVILSIFLLLNIEPVTVY